MFTSIRTLKSPSWGDVSDHASGIRETTLLQRGPSQSLRSLGSLGSLESQFRDENSLIFMKCIYLFIVFVVCWYISTFWPAQGKTQELRK